MFSLYKNLYKPKDQELAELFQQVGPIAANVAKKLGTVKEELYENKLKNKSNVADLEKQGYKKINTDDINVIDGDTYEVNGKIYRLKGIDNGDAYFDAAESSYMIGDMPYAQSYKNKTGDLSGIKPELLNTSVKTAKNIITAKKEAYLKDTGEKDMYDRSVGILYYGSPKTPNWFHAYDSAMVTKGEAVYGIVNNINNLTKRQKNIQLNANPFLYNSYPYEARKNPKALMLPSYKINK